MVSKRLFSNSSSIKRNPRYHSVNIEEKSYILVDNGNKNKLIELNETGSFIWEKLKRNMGFKKIINSVYGYYYIKSSRAKLKVEKEVSHFLEKLNKLGVLKITI